MQCRNGHESTETDYCSVCGVAMSAASDPVATATFNAVGSGSTSSLVCPNCGEPRPDPDARYCEVCRFDFVNGVPGPPPTASPPVVVADPAPAPPMSSPSVALPSTPVAAAAMPGSALRWEIAVTVDPSLDVEPDPETPCPINDPERTFPLDLAEMLIGRRDARLDIQPEIPLHDPGISRRHARLLRQPDGNVAILDLASANGTNVNGTELEAGVQQLLQDGDQITIGRWTRITLKARP